MAAADFYFAINATFRFILQNYGQKALVDYWHALGTEYYAPLIERFRSGGLDEVERYWQAFFEEEPGGQVTVAQHDGAVEIDVRKCPAVHWLRANHREIVQNFCRHCCHVSTAIADRAGLEFSLEGGDGTCRQEFREGGRGVSS